MGNQMQKSFISDKCNHELQTKFTFEINNFSEKQKWFVSPTFTSCECEWYVLVNTKDDYLCLYLCVANSSYRSFLSGWRTRATYSFVLFNQSGKELYRAAEISSLLCAQFRTWGDKTLSLSKLKEEGFLENNKLIIQVEVKVAERGGYVAGKDMFEVKGFEVLSTQVLSVSQLFDKHPDIAIDFKLNGKGLKTAYMNLLLSLIKTLCRPPLSFSETELNTIDNELSELIDAGFRLDWLKKKLEEVSLERKKGIVHDLRVQELKEQVNNMELALSDLKDKLENEKAKAHAAASKVLLFTDIL